MRLVDHMGRPITSEPDREYAKLKLQEYLEKHKTKCIQWIQEHGRVAFPVKYDIDRKQWYWVGDE